MENESYEKDKGHTCCFSSILFSGDFLVKLDKNDKGNTKAALPAKISPNRIELTPIDVPGLAKRTVKVTTVTHLN